MADKTYDVAIVGAGFSGPILAAKIAEQGVNPRNGNKLRVALVEAGGCDHRLPCLGLGSSEQPLCPRRRSSRRRRLWGYPHLQHP